MPYIAQSDRTSLDRLISQFPSLHDGQLAYTVYRLMVQSALQRGRRYSTFASIMGVIGLTMDEFRRRVIDPYEDQKREENGDVLY